MGWFTAVGSFTAVGVFTAVGLLAHSPPPPCAQGRAGTQPPTLGVPRVAVPALCPHAWIPAPCPPAAGVQRGRGTPHASCPLPVPPPGARWHRPGPPSLLRSCGRPGALGAGALQRQVDSRGFRN